MSSKQFYLKNEAALRRRLSAFVRKLPKREGGLAIRKVAFDVVAEVQGAQTTGAGGTPPRVDTGRNRAAWTRAAQGAGIEGASSLSKGPGSPKDGSGKFTAGDLESSLVLRVSTPYGYLVEHGTALMEPGLHLARAVAVVAARIPRDTSPESVRGRIVEAWKKG